MREFVELFRVDALLLGSDDHGSLALTRYKGEVRYNALDLIAPR